MRNYYKEVVSWTYTSYGQLVDLSYTTRDPLSSRLEEYTPSKCGETACAGGIRTIFTSVLQYTRSESVDSPSRNLQMKLTPPRRCAAFCLRRVCF